MATIMWLPEEVIAIILGYNDISIKDIINFRCVCKQFRWAVQYDKFWEKKIFQRWPGAATKYYDKQSKGNEQKESGKNEQKNNKYLIFNKTGLNYARELQHYMCQIMNLDLHEHYSENPNLPINFNPYVPLQKRLPQIMSDLDIKIFFFIDEIKRLLTQSSRPGCDLAERYRNINMLHSLKRYLLSKEWNRVCQQPDKQQLREQSAIIVAQWFQPQKNVSYYVKASLDSIALEILNYLREKHPDHSIFSTSAENFLYWKNNNIDDNHWNKAEGRQIIDTLEEYLFGKLNFRPPKSRLVKSLKYHCVYNVLENKIGEEIILFIIYHSVARRLGLHCDVAATRPNHFSIFWQPRYATNSSKNVLEKRCIRIRRGIDKFPDCLNIFYSHFNSKLIWHMQSTTQILIMLQQTLNVFSYDINVSDLIRFCRKSQSRPQEIKFAVGMIVTHGDQSDSSSGVIVGWHQINKKRLPIFVNCSHFLSPLNKSCYNYSVTEQQTYYGILSENNEICYVEEGAISLTTPKWINNNIIGRYFCTFENTHYVPNERLAANYPEDAAIIAKII